MGADVTGGFDALFQVLETELNEAISRSAANAANPGIEGGDVRWVATTIPIDGPFLASLNYTVAEIAALLQQNLAPLKVVRAYASHLVLGPPRLTLQVGSREVIVRCALEDGSGLDTLPDTYEGATADVFARWARLNAPAPARIDLRGRGGMVTVRAPMVFDSASPGNGTGIAVDPSVGPVDFELNPIPELAQSNLGDEQVRDAIFRPDEEDEFRVVLGMLRLTEPITIGSGPLRRVSSLDYDVRDSPAGRVLSVGINALGGCAVPGADAGAAPPLPGVGLGAAFAASNGVLFRLIVAAVEQSPTLAAAGVRFNVAADCRYADWWGAATVPVTTARGETVDLTLRFVTLFFDAASSTVLMAGGATTGGFCWTANIGFTVPMTLRCSPAGGITLNVGEVRTSPGINIHPLCVIAAVAIGVLVGAIVGSVVVGIVAGLVAYLALLGTVTAGQFVLGSVGGLPLPVALPVNSVGIPVKACVLDDYVASGPPAYRDMVPVITEGTRVVPPGHAVDLDLGSMGPVPLPDADLALPPSGDRLACVNGARLGVLTASRLEDVTYGDLQDASLTSTALLGTWIPGVGSGVVVGVRTSSGRYAKAAVRRSAAGVEIDYVTYDRPTPTLGVTATWEVRQGAVLETRTVSHTTLTVESFDLLDFDGPGQDPVNPKAGVATRVEARRLVGERLGAPDLAFPPPGIDLPDFGGLLAPKKIPSLGKGLYVNVETTYTTVQVHELEQWGVFHARTLFVDAPGAYTWTIDNSPVGIGSSVVRNAEITWHASSPVLRVHLPMQKDWTATVCVSVTDADGRRLSQCVTVKRLGKEDPQDTFDASIVDLYDPPKRLTPGGAQPDPPPPMFLTRGLTQRPR